MQGRQGDGLTEDQLEEVVEDEPLASPVLAELEGLRVEERARLIIDLGESVLAVLSGRYAMLARCRHTASCPVTRMMMPPLGVGCASRVLMLCLTFWKGRFCGTT